MTRRQFIGVLLVACVLLAVPVAAQTTIADTSSGRFVYTAINEALNDSKVNDPSAYRCGAPDSQRGLCKISGDILIGGRSDRRQEVTLMQFKQTEDGDNNLGSRGGEWWLGLARPYYGTSDDAMAEIVSCNTIAMACIFTVPVYAPNLSGSWPGSGHDTEVTGFYAYYQGRRLRFQPQADPASLGKIVIDDTFNDTKPWEAIGVIEPRMFGQRSLAMEIVMAPWTGMRAVGRAVWP